MVCWLVRSVVEEYLERSRLGIRSSVCLKTVVDIVLRSRRLGEGLEEVREWGYLGI